MSTWYEAAAYCNWLSEQEGLPKDQWCYLPNEAGAYAEGMKILPMSCNARAIACPRRRNGNMPAGRVQSPVAIMVDSVELLGKYAWYSSNSQGSSLAVRQLLPNELGLFDMLGNMYEWCHEQSECLTRKEREYDNRC